MEGSGDVIYKRIKLILDSLLQTGRRAQELRDWHGSNEHDDHELLSTLEVDGNEQRPNNMLPEAELSFDDMLMSEDDVEAATLPNTSPPPSPALPPILITQST